MDVSPDKIKDIRYLHIYPPPNTQYFISGEPIWKEYLTSIVEKEDIDGAALFTSTPSSFSGFLSKCQFKLQIPENRLQQFIQLFNDLDTTKDLDDIASLLNNAPFYLSEKKNTRDFYFVTKYEYPYIIARHALYPRGVVIMYMMGHFLLLVFSRITTSKAVKIASDFLIHHFASKDPLSS